MNFLKVKVQGGERRQGHWCRTARWTRSRCQASGRCFKVGDKAILGLRPQYLSVAHGCGQLHGSVALTERLGAETVVEIALKDGNPLIAALSQDAVFDLGAQMNLDFDPDKAHLFQPE